MQLFVGYSKAPEQPQSRARPICHSHTMMNTGREPATICITAYRSSLRYALRHERYYSGHDNINTDCVRDNKRYLLMHGWILSVTPWDFTKIYRCMSLTLKHVKVLVTTTDAQWEGMGDVGSARYEPALLPPCPTIRVLSYSSW